MTKKKKKSYKWKNMSLIVFLIVLLSCVGREFELKDIDGNIYRTNNYEGTLWMLENLKVTRDNQGNKIQYYYPNNDKKMKKEYGLLYDYETACKVCPKGWKLPDNSDWAELEKSIVEGKLAENYKDIGYWDREEVTNSSGFSIRPSGYGNNEEHPNYFGTKSYIWSISGTAEFKWTMIIEKDKREIRKAEQHPTYAYSIRCIKK